MRRNSGTVIGAGTVVLMSCVASIARADTAVNIVLQDARSGDNLSRIKINATNESQGLVHEVIVVASLLNGGKLPYDEKVGRVIESRIKDLGEVSDLPPGKSGSLTLNLTPGNYLLICNQPNHYQAGMWTRLTVTR